MATPPSLSLSFCLSLCLHCLRSTAVLTIADKPTQTNTFKVNKALGPIPLFPDAQKSSKADTPWVTWLRVYRVYRVHRVHRVHRVYRVYWVYRVLGLGWHVSTVSTP